VHLSNHRLSFIRRGAAAKPVEIVDAALGFASERDVIGYEDAVNLLVAVREVLDSADPASTATIDVDRVLLELFADTTCRCSGLVDALLDLRQTIGAPAPRPVLSASVTEQA
jgi:hypothetical protein